MKDADMTEELLKRLEAVRYEREDWHEPYGSIDLPCDADDYGAKAVHRNPDGPEAAALIRQLKADADLVQTYEAHDWWKEIVGGSYQPTGSISIKHIHPSTVKAIFDKHAGTEVSDVICALLFKNVITENREQFLTKFERERADAAEAEARQLKAENEELSGVRNAILSAGNSRNDGGMITFGVWSLDKLGTAFDRAAQSLNQTERGEAT